MGRCESEGASDVSDAEAKGGEDDSEVGDGAGGGNWPRTGNDRDSDIGDEWEDGDGDGDGVGVGVDAGCSASRGSS